MVAWGGARSKKPVSLAWGRDLLGVDRTWPLPHRKLIPKVGRNYLFVDLLNVLGGACMEPSELGAAWPMAAGPTRGFQEGAGGLTVAGRKVELLEWPLSIPRSHYQMGEGPPYAAFGFGLAEDGRAFLQISGRRWALTHTSAILPDNAASEQTTSFLYHQPLHLEFASCWRWAAKPPL